MNELRVDEKIKARSSAIISSANISTLLALWPIHTVLMKPKESPSLELAKIPNNSDQGLLHVTLIFPMAIKFSTFWIFITTSLR
jgi:hypothetical protein